MPVCEKALRQRQHAEVAERIYRKRCRLALDRLQCTRLGGQPYAGASTESDERLEYQQTALLLDPEGKAGRAYNARNTPHMFVINPEGKIVYEGAIDSKATPNPADIPSSTNYVKAALDESMSGKAVSNSNTRPYGCSVKYK